MFLLCNGVIVVAFRPIPPAQTEEGLALEFASLELQKDEGIALEAVKSNTARHPEKIPGE